MSDKYQTLKKIQVKTPAGVVTAEPGDWVQTDENGAKSVEKSNDSSVLPDDLPMAEEFDEFDGED